MRFQGEYSQGVSAVRFQGTPLPGVHVIELERHEDERGFFARTWCQEEFARAGLNPQLVQCNISFNPHRGTLRGLHYQVEPHSEAKLIRATRGAIYDVAVDVRPHSPAFLQWFAVELSADNGRALYIPEGCAHGFVTLQENTDVFYQMSHPYVPESGRGLRWNDPTIAIRWPSGKKIISTRDSNYPDYISQEAPACL